MVILCEKKTAITTEEFIAKAEKLNYEITEGTKESGIKESKVAISSEGYSVYFYVMESKKEAIQMFEEKKMEAENKKGNMTNETSINVSNYSAYTVSSGGRYIHICRVDNTLFFTEVKETEKESVKQLIKEIDY